MPVSLAYREPSTFVLNASGSVTFQEVDVAIHELSDDPRFAGGAHLLVDARLVEGAPSTQELRLIAERFKSLGRRLRSIAIVAESTFVYGLARMFTVFAEMLGVRVGAFRCVDEAQRWIAAQSRSA